MGAVMFYHLTRRPLNVVLPQVIDRARAQGWRVAIRGSNLQALRQLDQQLWLAGDESFLAHGLAGTGFDADQPILLTTETDTANGAACLISVDGAAVTPADATAMQRVCVFFDGNDSDALDHARGQWRTLTGQGVGAQYWSEESGKWEMKAEQAASA